MAQNDTSAFVKVGNYWITDISEWDKDLTITFTRRAVHTRLLVSFDPFSTIQVNSYNETDIALLNAMLALNGYLDFDGTGRITQVCNTAPKTFKPDASWNWEHDMGIQNVYDVYAQIGMLYVADWYEDVDIKNNNIPILKVKFITEPRKAQQVVLPRNYHLRRNILNAMLPRALRDLGVELYSLNAEK